jgi:acyl carrier protein
LKPTEAQICEWCTGYLATLLDISAAKIDPNAKMARLGMDSALMASLVMALEDWLEIEIDPEIVSDYPTIAQLARYLSSLSVDQTAPGRPTAQ